MLRQITAILRQITVDATNYGDATNNGVTDTNIAEQDSLKMLSFSQWTSTLKGSLAFNVYQLCYDVSKLCITGRNYTHLMKYIKSFIKFRVLITF